MKFIHKKDYFKLTKALAAAYQEKEKNEIGEISESRVMDRILSLGPIYPEIGYLEHFQRLVWRLAPVACLLVFLLGVALIQINLFSDYEITRMLMEDPADFSLFGLYSR